MGGIELRNGTLLVEREPNQLDELAIAFSGLLDEFDRASLEDSIASRVGGETIPIGPLELGIAYKLYLGTRTDTEDAVHLHTLFEESLSVGRLEEWVRRLGVEEEYERLTG